MRGSGSHRADTRERMNGWSRRSSSGWRPSGAVGPCEDPGPPTHAGPPMRRRRRRPALASAVALATLIVGAAPMPIAGQTVRYERLTWARLASLVPADGAAVAGRPEGEAPRVNQLPRDIRALHGRHVIVEGFVAPVDVTSDGVSLVALSRRADEYHPGALPRPTEWVLVRLPPGQRALVSDLPTTVRGRLFIDEAHDGRVRHLYRIEAESAVPQGVLGW